jgi:signal transduction histidine kinase
MTKHAQLPRPWFTTPLVVALVTALGFTLVAVTLTLRLRTELRAQILQREAEAIASMVALQQERALAELAPLGLGSEPADWFPLLLETSRLRGVIALRLFDAAGELRDALPMPATASLAVDLVATVRAGEKIARYFAHVAPQSLRYGNPEFLATGGAPLLEIAVPLQRVRGGEFVGVAQYWIDGAAMQAEFARLDRNLLLRAGATALLGAALVLSALAWAYRRLHAAHRELQARSEDLARANQEFSLAAKTSAVGAITAHLLHGIKNPLDGLEGYVSAQPRVADHHAAAGDEWRTALETTQRIRSLVNEVLAILREEQAGGARYRVTGAELLAAAEEKIRPYAQARGVTFSGRRDDDPDLPGRRAHLVLLVLDNLLRNACEATPAGGHVSLTVSRSGPDALFIVEDNGPGLPATIHEQLFQPVRSTKPGGGGIGLVLSQQLAQHAGGFLTLDKSDARGCRFRLTVPIASATPALAE